MRLKQLLGIVIALLVFTTMAAAAGSQLTDVKVATQGQATTVSVHATGAFTHTEYRPTDNLLLVDMTGVSAAKLDGKTQNLQSPGVVSYRVMGYKGVSGTEVSRLELALAPAATVSFSEAAGVLHVQVTPAASYGPAEARKPAAAKPLAMPTAKPEPRLAESKPARPVTVRNVSVARSKDGVAIEILGSGALTPKAMKLTAPHRVVIDLPNAVPLGKAREFAVNAGEVKSVRMARYQLDPPITRVVVDLASTRDYELTPQGNKLTLTLHAPAAVTAPPANPTEASLVTTAAAGAASPAAETKPAEFVAVEPDYKPVPQPVPQNDAAAQARARAAGAAAKFQPATLAVAPNTPYGVPMAASLQSQPAVNMAAQQAQNPSAPLASGPQSCSRSRYTGEPVSVNLKDVDLKDFFRLIHEISGLNIVLDPNVKGTVTLVLDEVPWDQALNIVLKNNSLECELEGNVLRIATLATMKKEADDQRAQKEARALAVPKQTVTRFLSYAHSKDLVPTIKKFLSPRGEVISDDRLNALIIEDIPSYLPAVDALLKQLDFKTQEVEIEARVVAATRNFAREFGTQWGFQIGNPTRTGGSVLPLNTSTGGAPQAGLSPLTFGGERIPLFSNLGGGTTGIPVTSGIGITNVGANYRLDFVLTMAEQRGLIKILSRPRVVTQNNIPSLVQQGVRIPVVTPSQLGGPPVVTYVNALLRLSVTPQITMENTIFLDIDVENTTPDFSRSVNGNPTLLTQQAKTQVLVTDGGTVLIGGVIQTQNSVSVRQVPLLGNIPILGNLFKNRSVQTSTQELLFFITPKIIQT